MSKKKAIKLATASVLAASSFAAVAPFTTQAATSVADQVTKATKQMKKAQDTYLAVGKTGKVVSAKTVQTQVDLAKKYYDAAKKAVIKAGGKNKDKYLAKLADATTYYNHAKAYIKALGNAQKVGVAGLEAATIKGDIATVKATAKKLSAATTQLKKDVYGADVEKVLIKQYLTLSPAVEAYFYADSANYWATKGDVATAEKRMETVTKDLAKVNASSSVGKVVSAYVKTVQDKIDALNAPVVSVSAINTIDGNNLYGQVGKEKELTYQVLGKDGKPAANVEVKFVSVASTVIDAYPSVVKTAKTDSEGKVKFTISRTDDVTDNIDVYPVSNPELRVKQTLIWDTYGAQVQFTETKDVDLGVFTDRTYTAKIKDANGNPYNGRVYLQVLEGAALKNIDINGANGDVTLVGQHPFTGGDDTNTVSADVKNGEITFTLRDVSTGGGAGNIVAGDTIQARVFIDAGNGDADGTLDNDDPRALSGKTTYHTPTPSSATWSATQDQVVATGSSKSISVEVKDQFGNPFLGSLAIGYKNSVDQSLATTTDAALRYAIDGDGNGSNEVATVVAANVVTNFNFATADPNRDGKITIISSNGANTDADKFVIFNDTNPADNLVSPGEYNSESPLFSFAAAQPTTVEFVDGKEDGTAPVDPNGYREYTVIVKDQNGKPVNSALVNIDVLNAGTTVLASNAHISRVDLNSDGDGTDGGGESADLGFNTTVGHGGALTTGADGKITFRIHNGSVNERVTPRVWVDSTNDAVFQTTLEPSAIGGVTQFTGVMPTTAILTSLNDTATNGIDYIGNNGTEARRITGNTNVVSLDNDTETYSYQLADGDGSIAANATSDVSVDWTVTNTGTADMQVDRDGDSVADDTLSAGDSVTFTKTISAGSSTSTVDILENVAVGTDLSYTVTASSSLSQKTLKGIYLANEFNGTVAQPATSGEVVAINTDGDLDGTVSATDGTYVVVKTVNGYVALKNNGAQHLIDAAGGVTLTVGSGTAQPIATEAALESVLKVGDQVEFQLDGTSYGNAAATFEIKR